MKVLFITLFLFQSVISIAQNIEITVLNKDSQPLPYAYILINNKPVTVSDTMGIAIIASNKLAVNDTLSVSYLGAFPAKIIYDESLKRSKKHCFYLDESAYNLNEVVVTYQDIEKLFRKSTRSIPLLNYNCKMDANFDASLSYPNQKGYLSSGTIKAINDRGYTPKYYNWFDPPIKFISNSDTAGIWRLLNNHTQLALNYSNLTLWRSQNDKKYEARPIYSYLGEKDKLKVFRILYSKIWIDNTYFQSIFYVDPKTKSVKKVEVEAFTDKPDQNGNFHRISLKFECEPYTHKSPKRNTIYLPVNIHYCYEEVNHMKFELKISEVSIK